eukprot:gnl/TRDRNA2_/TRDRNA2_150559_c0_seq2.p1 gnl/TRDRNA2_/TRDRNA2_150559_c0~~gnl/TRDRNA2_/TRDRNA2_150559_c0_seq2.p1  ORF type:complete len:423 (+),score=40.18 gnl/TRDRNA2_/TRDRNA2_150559_c0_seq2:160-1428(+)
MLSDKELAACQGKSFCEIQELISLQLRLIESEWETPDNDTATAAEWSYRPPADARRPELPRRPRPVASSGRSTATAGAAAASSTATEERTLSSTLPEKSVRPPSGPPQTFEPRQHSKTSSIDWPCTAPLRPMSGARIAAASSSEDRPCPPRPRPRQARRPRPQSRGSWRDEESSVLPQSSFDDRSSSYQAPASSEGATGRNWRGVDRPGRRGVDPPGRRAAGRNWRGVDRPVSSSARPQTSGIDDFEQDISASQILSATLNTSRGPLRASALGCAAGMSTQYSRAGSSWQTRRIGSRGGADAPGSRVASRGGIASRDSTDAMASRGDGITAMPVSRRESDADYVFGAAAGTRSSHFSRALVPDEPDDEGWSWMPEVKVNADPGGLSGGAGLSLEPPPSKPPGTPSWFHMKDSRGRRVTGDHG